MDDDKMAIVGQCKAGRLVSPGFFVPGIRAGRRTGLEGLQESLSRRCRDFGFVGSGCG